MRESRLWRRRRIRDFFSSSVRVAYKGGLVRSIYREGLDGSGEVEVIPIYPGFFSCFSSLETGV
jgi:hypothetical protein